AYGPQNDVTLKMPAFEWVHVQLHQQKGMISLSPPTICNSAPLIIMDIMLGKGRGTAGIAASSTAGAAVATPLLVAEIAPDFAEAAPAATTLVASCVVITAIVVPVITALWAKHGASRVRAT
ncbi:2-keto-3-deoxygluconate permease, partial [Escherichia coli]|uniref:2-keto-3-deoxygluconate permease n=1 Tax=Escherichia coli TaxID=562 RepID=UPI0032DA5836